MATIAELEAQIETLTRRLEETDLELGKSKRRSDQLETRALQAEGAAEREAIKSRLRIAAYQAGSEEGPIDAAVDSAMREATWKLDSKGELLRVLPDGQWDMTSNGDYVKASTWMRDYARKMPSFFPKAQAPGTADASTSSSSAMPQTSASAANPWTRENWNITRQSEYIAHDGIDKATAMADAAGCDVFAVKPPSR